MYDADRRIARVEASARRHRLEGTDNAHAAPVSMMCGCSRRARGASLPAWGLRVAKLVDAVLLVGHAEGEGDERTSEPPMAVM